MQSAISSQRAEVVEKYKEREAEIRLNIDQAMSSYTESIRQLGTTSGAAIDDGFERYVQFLKKRNAEQQVKLLGTIRRHTADYLKVKRTDDENWKKELLEWEAAKQ